MSGDNTATLLDEFVKCAGKYLAQQVLINQMGTVPVTDGGESLMAASAKKHEYAAQIRRQGPALATALEALGEDSTVVLRIAHCADGGGGPVALAPDWAVWKTTLQQIAIRLRCKPQAEGDNPPDATETPEAEQQEGDGQPEPTKSKSSEADIQPGKDKSGMSREEANIEAREVLKGRPPNGKRWSTRAVAKAVGCALGQVLKLPAWQAYAEEHPWTRSPASPKGVTLTDKTLAKEGRPDEELERVRAEAKEGLYDNEELVRLIDEQEDEDVADERQYPRRKHV